jgi:hypothetical protein
MMPITYERDDVLRRIVVTTIGNISREEMLAVMDRQAAEDTWGYGMLYDSRRATSVGTAADVKEAIWHVELLARTHGRRGPVAFVTDNPAAYGMVRMYSTLGDQAHLSVEVFRDTADAERWLTERTPPAA